MFQRILVSVDRSDDSRRAVEVTCHIAQRFGSEVFVVHARDVQHTPPMTAGLRPRVSSMETEKEAREVVDEAVGELAKGAGARVHAEVLAGDGSIATRILDAADRDRADLIVLGSRGMSDVQQFMLGGVAHKVVHLAKVPVLLAR